MPRDELRRLEQAHCALGRAVRDSRAAHQRALAEERCGRPREALVNLAVAEKDCCHIAELAHQLSACDTAVMGVAALRSTAVHANEARQRLQAIKKRRSDIERQLETAHLPPGLSRGGVPSSDANCRRRRDEVLQGEATSKITSFSLRRPSIKVPESVPARAALNQELRSASKVNGESGAKQSNPAPGGSYWLRQMRLRENIESIPQGLEMNLGGERTCIFDGSLSASPLVATPGSARMDTWTESTALASMGATGSSVGAATTISGVQTPLLSAARRLELSLRGIDPFGWAVRNERLLRQPTNPAHALSPAQKKIIADSRGGDESRSKIAPGVLPPVNNGSRTARMLRNSVSHTSSTRTRVSASISQAVEDVRDMPKLLVVDESPMLRGLLHANFARCVQIFPPLLLLAQFLLVCVYSGSAIRRMSLVTHTRR